MSVIYLVLASGAMVGPIELVEVPGIGRQMPEDAIELADELAAPAPGYGWAWENGEPTLLIDHRGTVYSTATGEAVLFDEFGDLPAGLTLKPPPGKFYEWRDGDWHEPEPTSEQLIERFRVVIQEHMDAAAKLAGYDDIKTAVTYAEEPAVPKFEAEGKALRAWRSLNWAYGYEQIAAVQSGARSLPTPEELIAELPPLVMP